MFCTERSHYFPQQPSSWPKLCKPWYNALIKTHPTTYFVPPTIAHFHLQRYYKVLSAASLSKLPAALYQGRSFGITILGDCEWGLRNVVDVCSNSKGLMPLGQREISMLKVIDRFYQLLKVDVFRLKRIAQLRTKGPLLKIKKCFGMHDSA